MRLPDRPAVPRGRALDPVSTAAAVGLAAWFAATVLSQHPRREFDRIAAFDKTHLTIPNWRFFAPEPAQHDYHVLVRTETADGQQTPWTEVSTIAPRSLTHLVWFPGRRREKALFDICHELIAIMGRPGSNLTRTPAYRMLRNYVALAVTTNAQQSAPPKGFQFVIARHTGHDPDHQPDFLFVSPYIQHNQPPSTLRTSDR